MAVRPVFVSNVNGKLCDREIVDFVYFNGFAKAQKQKSTESLHNSFLKDYPGFKVLEVSRYSQSDLGMKLSAFNLKVRLSSGQEVPLECAFQAGKVFEKGGSYLDLLNASPKDAKQDPRLKNSGKIIGFVFDGMEFPTIPTTFFYNWMYINALSGDKELAEEIMQYDAFTDIVFNPEKSLNCQAEAVAYFVALKRMGLLEDALESKEEFVRILYRQKLDSRFNIKRAVAEEPKEAQKTEAAPAEAPKSYESKFKTGEIIRHPKFKEGKIIEIELKEKTASLTVEFAVGIKKVDELWLLTKM